MKFKNGGLEVLTAVFMKMKPAQSREQGEQTAGERKIV
jgi:hypothetical protein